MQMFAINPNDILLVIQVSGDHKIIIRSLIIDRFIDARTDLEVGFSSFAFRKLRTNLKLILAIPADFSCTVKLI